MEVLKFKLLKEPEFSVEASLLKPESFVGKSIKEIENLELQVGNKKIKINSLFKISGKTSSDLEKQKVVIEGNLCKFNGMGSEMKGGELVIKGNCGFRVGEFMENGRIMVEGNVESWIGTEMKGGEIIIRGNVCDYVGCASRGKKTGMKGGRIEITGNARSRVGLGILGGEIIIKGNTESFVGNYTNGGKITIGCIERESIGYLMKKGEIFIDRAFKIPLYFRKIKDEKIVGGEYEVYEGDVSVSGSGLIYLRK